MKEICQRMGMNLTTLLTICCRKAEQERRIPFDITADADPFYSENNVRCLKEKLEGLFSYVLLVRRPLPVVDPFQTDYHVTCRRNQPRLAHCSRESNGLWNLCLWRRIP